MISASAPDGVIIKGNTFGGKMRNPEDEELRLRCFEAVKGIVPGDELGAAIQLYGWVTRQSDQTPRQKIDAALDAANVS